MLIQIEIIGEGGGGAGAPSSPPPPAFDGLVPINGSFVIVDITYTGTNRQKMKVVRFRLGFSIESGLDLGQGSNDEGMHYRLAQVAR